ncbi:MAG: hypothetical protein WKG01_22990 [Kofleriaceae bacterium]
MDPQHRRLRESAGELLAEQLARVACRDCDGERSAERILDRNTQVAL